jgi:hypothetical protein
MGKSDAINIIKIRMFSLDFPADDFRKSLYYIMGDSDSFKMGTNLENRRPNSTVSLY